MKSSLFLCALVLAGFAASAAPVLSISHTGSNQFTITVSNSPAGKPCWIQSGQNLPNLTPDVYFLGSNRPFTTNIAANLAQCFYGAASDRFTVTNWEAPTHFVPYPNQTNTNRPCRWWALPEVSYDWLLGTYPQTVHIGTNQWQIFSHNFSDLPIVTIGLFTNPPMFDIGAEIIAD